jgi:hypothetical protein
MDGILSGERFCGGGLHGVNVRFWKCSRNLFFTVSSLSSAVG